MKDDFPQDKCYKHLAASCSWWSCLSISKAFCPFTSPSSSIIADKILVQKKRWIVTKISTTKCHTTFEWPNRALKEQGKQRSAVHYYLIKQKIEQVDKYPPLKYRTINQAFRRWQGSPPSDQHDQQADSFRDPGEEDGAATALYRQQWYLFSNQVS